MFSGRGDHPPAMQTARCLLAPAQAVKLIWDFSPTVLLPAATEHVHEQGNRDAGSLPVLLVQASRWTIGVSADNLVFRRAPVPPAGKPGTAATLFQLQPEQGRNTRVKPIVTPSVVIPPLRPAFWEVAGGSPGCTSLPESEMNG
jgi:hypothetical protein